jgi:hypothetical protein
MAQPLAAEDGRAANSAGLDEALNSLSVDRIGQGGAGDHFSAMEL